MGSLIPRPFFYSIFRNRLQVSSSEVPGYFLSLIRQEAGIAGTAGLVIHFQNSALLQGRGLFYRGEVLVRGLFFQPLPELRGNVKVRFLSNNLDEKFE